MSNAGLEDWVARSEMEYVDLAVKAASGLDRLDGLRRTMRDRLRASPLLDDAGFTRDVEDAFRKAWKGWCAR